MTVTKKGLKNLESFFRNRRLVLRMTKRSIIDGAVEYIPRKTKEGNPVVVRVLLLTVSKMERVVILYWIFG